VIPPIAGAIGPLGASEWSIPAIGGPVDPTATGAVGGVGSAGSAGGSGGFGGALTNAISSLEQSQTNATSAAQALATGQLTDPTQAVTAVENASLAMQLAGQVRTKLDEAATQILQTQV
jgi:flagellar hook-basal body complex protein FliE